MSTTNHTRSSHFLHISRHRFSSGQRPRTFDVSTVAAADYDVHVQSGFMPPQEPVDRLLNEYEVWEDLLERALGTLRLSMDASATVRDKEFTECWREEVHQMSIMDTEPLFKDERLLRRAHVALSYLTHLYVHSVSHNPSSPISIPPSLSIPLIKVSRELGVPPIMTYADSVLWNWRKINTSLPTTADNLSVVTNLTGTPDEAHFYLTSARIELRGVEALSLMRMTLDETFLGDTLAIRRVCAYLGRLAVVIDDISAILVSVRNGCDPVVFYNQFRPWINGGTAHPAGWKFEGVELSMEEEVQFEKLSGPSAAQCSLIHALDIFLGVEHAPPHTSHSSHSAPSLLLLSPPSFSSSGTFLQRQQLYMPRHHRAFLSYLHTVQNPVRALVLTHQDHQPKLKEAYNLAVEALKTFRDEHIRIATIYIITQARRDVNVLPLQPPSGTTVTTTTTTTTTTTVAEGEGEKEGPRGSGGSLLVPFLKSARDDTSCTVIHG